MKCNYVLYFLAFYLVLSASAQDHVHSDLGKLSDYDTSNLVWLGSVIGEIVVNPETSIKVEKYGNIEWLVENGAYLMENDVICRTNAEKIRLSKRELDLKKTIHRNQLLDLEESFYEKKKAQSKKIAELVKSISELQMTPTERSLLGVDFEARLRKDRVPLEKDLKDAKTKLEGDYFSIGYESEKAKLLLELDKVENNHKELLRGSEFRAESSGSLKILISEVIKSGSEIGIIINTGTAEAIVEISESRLTKIPPKELVVRTLGDDGILYFGNYTRTIDQEAYQQRAPVYVFDIFKSSDQGKVPSTLSGKRIIEVCRALEKPGHIVPKADLLFRFPEEINKDGWPAFIQKRWENVNVDYIGPRELVISKKNEN